MKCKHNDGWILDTEDIVINDYERNNDIECLVRCNHYGCNYSKKIQFDIVNIIDFEDE
jgi:hypothetical protein